MKKNVKLKYSKVLLLLLVMILSIGNVFAYNIRIFPKREMGLGTASDVLFRLYESPHKDTAKEFFHPDNLPERTSGTMVKINDNLTLQDNPPSGHYHQIRYIFSSRALSDYTKNSADATKYGYIKYDSFSTALEGGPVTPKEYINAQKIYCRRPIEVANSDSYILCELDATNYVSNGVGEKYYTLLCARDNPNNCTQDNADHSVVSIQAIDNNSFQKVKTSCIGHTNKDEQGDYVYLSKEIRVGLTTGGRTRRL